MCLDRASRVFVPAIFGVLLAVLVPIRPAAADEYRRIHCSRSIEAGAKTALLSLDSDGSDRLDGEIFSHDALVTCFQEMTFFRKPPKIYFRADPDERNERAFQAIIDALPVKDLAEIYLSDAPPTADLMAHAVKLEQPPHGAAPTKPSNIIDIRIGPDGTLSWNDMKLADYAALDAQLNASNKKRSFLEFHLFMEKGGRWGSTITLMRHLQKHGFHKIGLIFQQ